MNTASEVLVLVANERNATLCVNSGGVSHLLRSVDRAAPTKNIREDATPEHASSSARHTYACELMMALGRSAKERDYDGVIIFAEAPMMEELRQVQTSAISRLLIAQIVGVPTGPCRFPGRSAANAELAYRGALN